MCDEKSWLKLGTWAGSLILLMAGMVHGAKAETVAVDFAVIKGPATHRASGFLHGISTEQPDNQFVRQLKPRLFRLHAREVLTPLALSATNRLGGRCIKCHFGRLWLPWAFRYLAG